MSQYIQKSALVAEIERRIKGVNSLIDIGCNNKEEFLLESRLITKIHTYEDILDFLNTLEVKEVDLEKELDFNAEVSKFINTFYKNAKIGHKLMIRRTAKYFYDLMLKSEGRINYGKAIDAFDSELLQDLWLDAQGDNLPEIDREVLVLLDNGKVCFAHRPKKKGYLGKNMVTGNIETFYPQVYDKGGWNIPNVKWWLDLNLPNKEEQE